GPADVLVAARPGAARVAGNRRGPRAGPSQGLRSWAAVLGARRRPTARTPRRPRLAPAQLARHPQRARCMARGTGRTGAGHGAARLAGGLEGDQRIWWAGAESNCHSRRRGFYRPLGSPPAQPTHWLTPGPPGRGPEGR